MAALRGDISFRYLKQFFLVLTKLTTSRQGVVLAVSYNIERTIFLHHQVPTSVIPLTSPATFIGSH
jgi:hypothetical protein